jgi:integrase
VGEFLNQWLEESVKPSARPRTLESYSFLVKKHLTPALGRFPLVKLSPIDVQRLINSKIATGKLSARTVRYMHAVLRSALNRAVEWHLIKRNVALRVRLPRAAKPKIRPLTCEEAKYLLEAVTGSRLEALYSVALSLGLREGEILGLRWEDVDLDGARLRVERALQELAEGLVSGVPKTEESRRTLILPSFAVTVLRTHRVHQIQERLIAGSRWYESGLVFTTTVGTPIHPRNLRKHLRGALQDAGLPQVRFHDLRHTAGSLLAAQGVTPRVIMEILGHTQVTMTMNTYVHGNEAMQREAAARVGNALRPGA